jgi:hypothetical protein
VRLRAERCAHRAWLRGRVSSSIRMISDAHSLPQIRSGRMTYLCDIHVALELRSINRSGHSNGCDGTGHDPPADSLLGRHLDRIYLELERFVVSKDTSSHRDVRSKLVKSGAETLIAKPRFAAGVPSRLPTFASVPNKYNQQNIVYTSRPNPVFEHRIKQPHTKCPISPAPTPPHRASAPHPRKSPASSRTYKPSSRS